MSRAAGSSKVSDVYGDGVASSSKITTIVSSRGKKLDSDLSQGAKDEPGKIFAIGDNVLAVWQGTWYKAKVEKEATGIHQETDQEVPCYYIHYIGFRRNFDEYVMADSLMHFTPENKLWTDSENLAAEQSRQAAAGSGNKPGSASKKRKMDISVAEEVRNDDSQIVEDSVVEVNEELLAKKPRDEDKFALLWSHYCAYNPDDPQGKSASSDTKIRAMYESLSSLSFITPLDSDVKKTSEEKEATFMRATEKLLLMKCAEQRKAQDEAVMSVVLPPGIKRVMAENYIATVQKEKVLKFIADPEKSFRAIIGRYVVYAEKAPTGFTFYQQKARIAEAKSLVDNFPKMFPCIALRVEWPQWSDMSKPKKRSKDISEQYGLVHVVRAIQLMVEMFNQDGKRLAGPTRLKLMAIYQDMLAYLETSALKYCDEGDAMYADVSDEYVTRIPAMVFETEEKDATWHPFHFLGDDFFQNLMAKTQEDDHALKLAWKV